MAGSFDEISFNHIGFYGGNVGSFVCAPSGLKFSSGQKTVSLPFGTIEKVRHCTIGRMTYIRVCGADGESRFDGFQRGQGAWEKFIKVLKDENVSVEKVDIDSSGGTWGSNSVSDSRFLLSSTGGGSKEVLSLDLREVSQCVTPGNNRNELELQFNENDYLEDNTDQLVQIRLYVPPTDEDGNPPEEDAQEAVGEDGKPANTACENLRDLIAQDSNVLSATGASIVNFPDVAFVSPRGRYTVELLQSSLRMQGAKYDFLIKYEHINKLFLLEKPDEIHQFFILSLEKPIRQGQQRYQHLVIQVSKEQCSIDLALPSPEAYPDLSPTMTGKLSNTMAKVFKNVTGKKVFVSGKYLSNRNSKSLQCSFKANDGYLYPLEKQMLFLTKPTILVRFEEIETVEFQRYGGSQAGSTRNFDLAVTLKRTTSDMPQKEYLFSGIEKSEYKNLSSFLMSKKIRVKNAAQNAVVGRKQQNFSEVGSDDDVEDQGDDSDSEDDGDYGDADAAKDEESDSSSDSGSDSDSDMSEGSDVREARAKSGGRNGAEEGASRKRKAAQKSKPASKGGKKKKKKKDPNAPKGARGSYMFFSNAKRAELKAARPDITFGELATETSALWKAATADDKKPFEDMAAEDKRRYQKEMESYVPPENSSSSSEEEDSSDSSDSESDSEDSSDDDGGKKKKKKKKKKTKKKKGSPAKRKKRDPNAPKAAKTAYQAYSNFKRAELKASRPELTFGELATEISSGWKVLSSDDKKPFEEEASADKVRYKKENDEYEEMKRIALAMDDSDDDAAGGMDDDSDDMSD